MGEDQPRIQAYTLESSIAEKYQAMVNLDMANSRMKDFYDIYFLSDRQSFEGEQLQRAIRKTFERRETQIPQEIPTALTERFYKDEDKNQMWKVFIEKISDEEIPRELEEVVKRLKKFLWAVTQAINNGSDFNKRWTKQSEWN